MRSKKKLLSIVASLALLTMSINANNLEKKDENNIKELISETLQYQNSLQKNQNISNKEDFLKKMPKEVIYATKKYNKKEYMKELSQSFKNTKDNGFKIIDSSFKINKIECMYLEDDSVDCYVKEIIETKSASENNLKDIVNGGEHKNLKFNLKKDDNYKWFIEREEILGFEGSSLLNSDDSFEQENNPPINEDIQRIDINKLKKNSHNYIDESYEKRSGYNGSTAAAYARKYVYNYNSDYRTFSHDCTNFASQSVKAGGWVYDSGYYRDNHNWWYNWANQTWSWAAAHNFWWFNHYHNRSYTVSSTCSLQLGDIVSADWQKDGHVDHSMIVTKKSGCNIWLSYHSTNTLNKPFSALPSNANYWGWHITGTNN